MTNDDFLDDLRADWRRQTVDVSGLAARVAARQRRAGLVTAGNALAIATMAILACLFGSAAIRQGDALLGVAAIAFLLAAPAVLFEMLDFRRATRLRYDDSPAGVLRQARDQAMFSRRRLRSARIAALLLVGAGLAAWALVPAGLAHRDTVIVITSGWAAAALLSWLWQFWRDRRLVETIAGYDRLRAELDEGSAADEA
ncbi:hypothetical protein [Sphingosinicella sp.]|uniref:hypothetical protein n=1 Tax=Sphingosinicella sp. TaxID=1917971 RepID=UPI00403806F3